MFVWHEMCFYLIHILGNYHGMLYVSLGGGHDSLKNDREKG